jgi:GNAT superfamily N-acetyltransferase
MSRGVGSVFINHILRLASDHRVQLRAEFISTGRNRMMYVTYKFAGFKELVVDGNFITFEHALERVPPFPDYMQVILEN